MPIREQDIRHDKTTSNISVAQALLADTPTIYGAHDVPRGIRKIAGHSMGRHIDVERKPPSRPVRLPAPS